MIPATVAIPCFPASRPHHLEPRGTDATGRRIEVCIYCDTPFRMPVDGGALGAHGSPALDLMSSTASGCRAARAVPRSGRSGTPVKTAFRRHWPREADTLHRIGRTALSQAIGSPKKGASALGVSARLVRYWTAGEKTSPVGHALEMVASVEHPFPLVAAVRTAAIQRILNMDDEQLIAAFHQAQRDETSAQGELDCEQMARGAGHTVDEALAEIEARSLRHAAELERIAAITGELRKRAINPWRS